MFSPLWNLSGTDRMLLPGASGHPSAVSGHAEGVAEMMNSAIVASGHVSSSASGRMLTLVAVSVY